MFENTRRGRHAKNFTTNVPKILDLKSSFEKIFSENCRWVSYAVSVSRNPDLVNPTVVQLFLIFNVVRGWSLALNGTYLLLFSESLLSLLDS